MFYNQFRRSPLYGRPGIRKLLAVVVLLFVTFQLYAQDKSGAWYPRTEKVGPDEMFIVALGTGMPTPITRAQKSSSWYVELGNGDIFLFDVGSGSVENLFALRPDFARVDKAGQLSWMGHEAGNLCLILYPYPAICVRQDNVGG